MKTSAGKRDQGLANAEFAQDLPPIFNFHYKFNTPFLGVCEAYVKQWNWEQPTRVTSLAKVEQLDDDRIVLYRRIEKYNQAEAGYEQIIFNRQNSSIEADLVGRNPNGSTFAIERTVIRPDLSSKAVRTLVDQYVLDSSGATGGKIEIFKAQIAKLHKTLKFIQWDKE